jgi:Family of unknown function (DUF6101)
MVELSREAVVFRRVVAGVSMSIRVDSSAFRGITLRIVGLEDGRFRYIVQLLHHDRDLSVRLAEDEDVAAVKAQWRKWISFFGLPAFVGRTSSSDVPVNVAGVDLVRCLQSGRRRGRGPMARRPGFVRRGAYSRLRSEPP